MPLPGACAALSAAEAWRPGVAAAVPVWVPGPVGLLKKALIADYVVLGGGGAKKLDELPDGVELGHNRNAFLGGVRLWQTDPRTRRTKWQIL